MAKSEDKSKQTEAQAKETKVTDKKAETLAQKIDKPQVKNSLSE